MKKIVIIASMMLALAGCRKKTETVTVVKDCTGTYLRFNNRDHPVCNYEALEDVASGSEAEITYVRAGKNNCDGRERPVCAMPHHYPVDDQWLIVKKVRN